MSFYGYIAYIIKVEQCEDIKNPYIDGATFTHLRNNEKPHTRLIRTQTKSGQRCPPNRNQKWKEDLKRSQPIGREKEHFI